MKDAVIHIKTDKRTKSAAQKTASDLGLSLSSVLHAYLKQFTREKRVEFSVEGTLRREVGKALLEASEDYKKGINISPVFSTAKEMDDYLDSP